MPELRALIANVALDVQLGRTAKPQVLARFELPKNAWLADWLIGTALELDQPLVLLEDDLERLAHLEARHAVGI